MRHRRARRWMLLSWAMVVLGGLVLLAHPGAAQDSAAVGAAHASHDTTNQAYRYRLLGVYDAQSGQPVEGAEVSDAITGASARTSSTGTVSLFFLPDGGSLVRIRKLGYGVQTMMVAISPADTVPLTVILQPAVQLPEVVTTGRARYISPNLRGFEERRRIGATGYFISDSALRKEEDRTLANVLRTHMPAIQILPTGAHAELLMPSPRCLGGGPPDVYLDGVKLSHVVTIPPKNPRKVAGSQPIDLSQFDVVNLAGVEYYPDGNVTPVEYAGTSTGCGTLLLWTREK